LCIEYNRLLRVEAQIESTVIKEIECNDGVYLPADVFKERHVFFAVDNIDFQEDTYDGQRTLHGTAMAIYQRTQPGDGGAKVQVTGHRPQARSQVRPQATGQVTGQITGHTQKQ